LDLDKILERNILEKKNKILERKIPEKKALVKKNIYTYEGILPTPNKNNHKKATCSRTSLDGQHY
jgi:hypothetical protein